MAGERIVKTVEVRQEGAERTAAALDKLASAGARAADATNDVAESAAKTPRVFDRMGGAADEAAKAQTRLTGANENGQRVFERTLKVTGGVETNLNRLKRQVDQNFRATESLSKAQETLDRSYARGLVSQAEHTRLLSLAEQRYSSNSAELRRMSREIATANDNLAQTSTHAGSATRALGGMGTAARGMVAGLAAGGVAALTAAVKGATDSYAQLNAEAQRAGLDTTTFQELGYVARQNRVSLDALTDGLKELNLRADEFIVTGAGSAAESFQRLGYTAEELAVKLKNPSDLFAEIIGKLGDLDRAAQIRIADELFGGTGGEQFIQIIAQGEDGIRRLVDEAHEFGIVADESMIQRAVEIDRQFNRIADTIGTRVKSAVVEVAGFLNGMVDGLRDVENQQAGTLESRLAEIADSRASLAARLAEMQQQDAEGWGFFSNANEIKLVQSQIAELAAEAEKLQGILDSRIPPAAASTGTAIRESVVAPTKEATKALRDAEAAKRALLSEADAAVGKFFPFETAIAEAERLQAIIDDTTNGLSDLQRQALGVQINDNFARLGDDAKKSEAELAKLRDTATTAAQDIEQAGQGLGDIFADIFSSATRDGESFFASVIRGLAGLGSQLAAAGARNLFGSLFGTAPAGGPRGGIVMAPAASVAPTAVTAGRTFAAPVAAVERRVLPALANFSTELTAAAKAIRTIESGSAGGNYSARGPVTKNGDRALGAYQVMGNNVPEWSKAALGRVVSNVEFLSSPDLQDAVFAHRFGGYMQKYGAEGESRAWFAGEGGMRNYKAQDVVGTSVGGYGSRFGQLYGQHLGSSDTILATSPREYRRITARGVQDGLRSYGGPAPSSAAQEAMSNGSFDGFVPRGLTMGQAGMGALFGLGGIAAQGYQSGNPLMGGLSGLMGGAQLASQFGGALGLGAAAGPLGMGVGALAGCIGGELKTRRQREEGAAS